MEKKEFILSIEDRGGSSSTSFSGRSEGRAVRAKHRVDELDNDTNNYVVKMPEDTTSFNPSFFLGLFYLSIKKLGMEGFKSKYLFNYNNLRDYLRPLIQEDIAECLRRASNELNGITGLDAYIGPR